MVSVRYNPAQTEMVGATATDRSIMLYDTRSNSAIRKIIMEMRSNTLRWNPMEPFHFTVVCLLFLCLLLLRSLCCLLTSALHTGMRGPQFVLLRHAQHVAVHMDAHGSHFGSVCILLC